MNAMNFAVAVDKDRCWIRPDAIKQTKLLCCDGFVSSARDQYRIFYVVALQVASHLSRVTLEFAGQLKRQPKDRQVFVFLF